MGSAHESESLSNNHSILHTDATLSESDLLTPSKKSGSSASFSSSSSSSSGSSFDEDFFLREDNEQTKSEGGTINPPKLDEDSHLASIYGEKIVPGLTPESPQNASPKQSPPIQVMGRTEEPGKYRIPSSVFARSKSSTPQEWSVCSNESLFSIHVGNNSFSRDQLVLMGRSGELDLGKSGELVFPLNKSGELIIPHKKTGGFNDFQNISPPGSTVVNSEKKRSDLGEGLGVTEAAAETMKEVLRVAAEDRNKPKLPADEPTLSSSVSRHSDGSITSIQSFAFPILTGDGGKIGSVKKDSLQQVKQTSQQQKQNQQQQQPKAGTTPFKGGTRWFSCLSCCTICR